MAHKLAVDSRKLTRLLKTYPAELSFILGADRSRSFLILEQLLDRGVFSLEEYEDKINASPM